jgi:hypothetical protein
MPSPAAKANTTPSVDTTARHHRDYYLTGGDLVISVRDFLVEYLVVDQDSMLTGGEHALSRPSLLLSSRFSVFSGETSATAISSRP